jgi:hypothetical protein
LSRRKAHARPIAVGAQWLLDFVNSGRATFGDKLWTFDASAQAQENIRQRLRHILDSMSRGKATVSAKHTGLEDLLESSRIASDRALRESHAKPEDQARWLRYEQSVADYTLVAVSMRCILLSFWWHDVALVVGRCKRCQAFYIKRDSRQALCVVCRKAATRARVNKHRAKASVRR